jgi:hypothetical protein
VKPVFAAVCAMIAVAGLPARAGTPAEHNWQIYTNVRFGYHICYPADLLIPQPEADNGDGRVFTAASGASLRVWGVNNAAEQSLAVYTNDLVDSGAKVTYRTVEPPLSVISGRKDGEIFYAKTLSTKDASDAFRTFVLTYAESQASLFDGIADKLSSCFTAPP